MHYESSCAGNAVAWPGGALGAVRAADAALFYACVSGVLEFVRGCALRARPVGVQVEAHHAHFARKKSRETLCTTWLAKAVSRSALEETDAVRQVELSFQYAGSAAVRLGGATEAVLVAVDHTVA